MGRTYAGVLGTLACGLILARGVLAGGNLEGTLAAACGGLFGFAAWGFIAGNLAERFTNESVRQKFEAALKSMEADKTKKKTVVSK